MRQRWNKRVRVLVADDSLVMRAIFRELFSLEGPLARMAPPELELCGLANDGIDCLEAVARLQPDVLLLDLEMPRMHGLDVLSRLRTVAPWLPTIMCSTLTARGARTTLDGLALGAADYVTKPTVRSDKEHATDVLAREVFAKIEGLAGWAATRRRRAMDVPAVGAELGRPPMETSSHRALTKPDSRRMISGSLISGPTGDFEVVAIGISTGGPSALESMLPRLPGTFPAPVLIVQHMPKLFSTALAERLNRCCALRVQEAYDGAVVSPGTIWLAPGDAQMEVRASVDGRGTVVRLREGEPTDLYRPAVDTLFASVARRYGAATLGLVMTGMGSDGLLGARMMREAGGAVLVQDQSSSAVWGMPGRVVEAGLETATLPLDAIAGELVRLTARRASMGGTKGFGAPQRASHLEVSNELL